MKCFRFFSEDQDGLRAAWGDGQMESLWDEVLPEMSPDHRAAQIAVRTG